MRELNLIQITDIDGKYKGTPGKVYYVACQDDKFDGWVSVDELQYCGYQIETKWLGQVWIDEEEECSQ